MHISMEQLRRDAKALKKAVAAGHEHARVKAVTGAVPEVFKHSDALHVLARESGFDSWPKLKFAVETTGLERAEKRERLKMALFHGQGWRVRRLLDDAPGLGKDSLGIMCALYDVKGVQQALEANPDAVAMPVLGPRVPLLHLTFSRWWQHGGSEDDMLAVADILVEAGADVNVAYEQMPGMPLSALYGAVGHALNLRLTEWLLDHGADPNDGESLYHGCDIGAPALRLLLQYGAKPERTNALPRALDFNDLERVEALLEGGADPNEGVHWPKDKGEAPFVIPALHQAARRLCSGEIVERLLQAGGNPDAVEWGHTAYALACMYGNKAAAKAMADHGCNTDLTVEEKAISEAVAGRIGPPIDPDRLPKETRDMIRSQVHLPGGLERTKALVAVGLPFDHVDPQGLTPLQIAGWEGRSDIMEYLLTLGPRLNHINGYGGDLMSTIIHGAENAPPKPDRDHIACARLALDATGSLRKSDIAFAGDPDMADFLSDWAERHPDHVTEARLG